MSPSQTDRLIGAGVALAWRGCWLAQIRQFGARQSRHSGQHRPDGAASRVEGGLSWFGVRLLRCRPGCRTPCQAIGEARVAASGSASPRPTMTPCLRMTSLFEKRARSSVSSWSLCFPACIRGDPAGSSCAGAPEAHDQPAHPSAANGQSYRRRCDPDCRAGRLNYAEFADHGFGTRIARPQGCVMSNPELPGSYALRFRLAGWEALAPQFGLLSAAFGIFAPDLLYLRVLFIALGGFLTVPYVIMLAGRTTVFRADQAGITLGPRCSCVPRFHLPLTRWCLRKLRGGSRRLTTSSRSPCSWRPQTSRNNAIRGREAAPASRARRTDGRRTKINLPRKASARRRRMSVMIRPRGA
jgi:hypothetical protein